MGDTAGLTGLQTIDFTSNSISSLPSDFLSDSDELTSFSATKAKLTMLPTGLFADMEDLLSVSLGKNLFATFPEGLKSLTQDNNPNLESLHIGPDFPHGGLFSEPVSGWIATLPTSLDDLLLQYIQLTSDEAVTLSENLTELHTLEFDYRKMDLAHFIEFIENIKTNSGTTGFRELQLTATGEFAVGCGSSSNGSPLASYESASATVKQEFADAFDGL